VRPPTTLAILETMDPDDLRRLREAGSETRVPAGQLLTERGLSGTGLFVILEGTVLVEAPERTRELGPGAVIGERALLSPDGVRSARVQATSELLVLAIDRGEFERLCSEDPAFASRVAETPDGSVD
jgi:CRP-like cAMP-binding protein